MLDILVTGVVEAVFIFIASLIAGVGFGLGLSVSARIYSWIALKVS